MLPVPLGAMLSFVGVTWTELPVVMTALDGWRAATLMEGEGEAAGPELSASSNITLPDPPDIGTLSIEKSLLAACTSPLDSAPPFTSIPRPSRPAETFRVRAFGDLDASTEGAASEEVRLVRTERAILPGEVYGMSLYRLDRAAPGGLIPPPTPTAGGAVEETRGERCSMGDEGQDGLCAEPTADTGTVARPLSSPPGDAALWDCGAAAVSRVIIELGGERLSVMSHREDIGVEGMRCAGVIGVPASSVIVDNDADVCTCKGECAVEGDGDGGDRERVDSGMEKEVAVVKEYPLSLLSPEIPVSGTSPAEVPRDEMPD